LPDFSRRRVISLWNFPAFQDRSSRAYAEVNWQHVGNHPLPDKIVLPKAHNWNCRVFPEEQVSLYGIFRHLADQALMGAACALPHVGGHPKRIGLIGAT
jgi:hypothetical protein